MHLVCLGVVRKLLNIWVSGKCGPSRLSAALSHKLSSNLINLRAFIPSEFARKPRSVTFLPRWKATEFRQFILYTGVIVLKGVLPNDYYKHFIIFHVAIYILCSNRLFRRLNRYAHELLVYFVSNFPTLYGVEQVSYNVHGLVHLAKDSLQQGPLDFYSAFKFENYLGELKSSLKTSFNPLQQLICRLYERENCTKSSVVNGGEILLTQSRGFPVLNVDCDRKYYASALFSDFSLKINNADCICKLDSGEVVRITAFFENSVGKFASCVIATKIGPAYQSPCGSDVFDIIKVKFDSDTSHVVLLHRISSKVVCLPDNDSSFVCFQFVSS